MFSQTKINTPDELISQAELALTIVREKMMSSHRIVSRIDFPETTEETILKIAKSVGIRKTISYLNYQNNLYILRETAKQCADLSTVTLSDALAVNIAVASFGAGECEEHAALTAYELLKLNPTLIVEWITLKMGHDEHHLILLGNSMRIREGTFINEFDKFNDDCIFIDSFLNIAGKANCMEKMTGSYLSAANCTHVSSCHRLTASSLDLLALTNKINDLINLMADKLEAYKFYITPHIESALDLLFSIDDPFCRLMVKIKQQCNTMSNGLEIFAAALESMLFAFHKACAYGETAFVELILQNISILDSFDINASSPTNQTALDWAQAITNPEIKKKMIATLEAYGALTYDQTVNKLILKM